MMGLIGNNISAEFFLMVFLCIIIIAYFIYKEWPEFKKRIRGNIDDEVESKTVEGRLARLEKRMTEVTDMLGRDYQRLNVIERVAKDNTKAINDSLEERRIIMSSLEACLVGLRDIGADASIDKVIRAIHEYLNNQAHTNQSVIHDMDVPNGSPYV